ncbi:trans-sialidase [Trypanosoma cruzi]|nr:trans-sialidase [Trypanosoma cruzi]
MPQDGNKGSVYVNAELVGSPETIRKLEMREAEITRFYIGGDEGDSGSNATVTNVFLYNRPLSDDELKLVKRSGDGSMRGGVLRALLLLLGLCGPLLRNRSGGVTASSGSYMCLSTHLLE